MTMTHVHPKPLTAESFANFGQVVTSPGDPPLAEDPTFRFWSDVANYLVVGETEIGLCTVFSTEGRDVTWMERHERTPELLIPIDAPFILPVMRSDERADSVEAFRVNIGEAVVIGQNVWHSACQPVDTDEATYFVIFRRGTPAEDVRKTGLEGVCVNMSGPGA